MISGGAAFGKDLAKATFKTMTTTPVAFYPQRFLFGQSATLWPSFPHPWQVIAGEGR